MPKPPAGIPVAAYGLDLPLQILFRVVDSHGDHGGGGSRRLWRFVAAFGLWRQPVFFGDDEFGGLAALVRSRIVAVTNADEALAVLVDQFPGARFAGFADGADVHVVCSVLSVREMPPAYVGGIWPGKRNLADAGRWRRRLRVTCWC